VRGRDYIAVPHKIDEAKVLRNLGIQAPSPILYYYDWPGKFTPYSHQRNTAAFMTMHKKCLILNDIGTGKTMSALWAADYLMRIGKVRKVLIVSPLSTLERVWGDAVFSSFVDRKAVVLHGSAERRKRLITQRPDADFFVVNHDGLPVVLSHLPDDIDLIIYDEAAVLRNTSTQRFKVLNKWMRAHTDARLWLMTGTPTPNEPTDAYALAKLIESPAIPPTAMAFKDMVMLKTSMWNWTPRADSAHTVSRILQPSVRFTREECLDLPDTVTQSRQAEMTAEQQTHYKAMMKTLVAEAAAGSITAANEAIKAQKLVQILCGVAYGQNGQNIEIDASPRVSLLKELIDEVGGKCIVFVPLTGALHMLEQELSKRWSVGVVNGAVSSTNRNQIFSDFQNTKKPHILLAHPATMAHGLTLTAANSIIWYAPPTSNETYLQANGRIERIGKRHVSNLIHIESTPLERRMYKRLQNKQAMQGLLLDIIQNEGERS